MGSGEITGSYVIGKAYNVYRDVFGNISEFSFEGSTTSVFYSSGEKPFYITISGSITLASGLRFTDISNDTTIIATVSGGSAHIVDIPGLIPSTPGDGTLDNPYSVSEALQIAMQYNSKESAPWVYCICRVSQVGTTIGYAGDIGGIMVTDGINEMLIYYLRKYEGADIDHNFTSVEDLPFDTELLIYGRPFTYNGTTPEFADGTYCVTIDGVHTKP